MDITTLAVAKSMCNALDQKYKMLVRPAKTWADIQQIVRSGYAADAFREGDQLVCKKGNAELTWDIIGIDSDPQFEHNITLQLHDCWTGLVQFDAPEAFYYCENGLAAGTYYFTIASDYDPTYNTYAATGYQFTLTNAVPAGGQLAIAWTYNTQASGMKISSYSGASSSTPIESNVSVSSGTAGTNLGAFSLSSDRANGRNSLNIARYGSNSYKESAVRQWLNSSAAAGSVWTPQNVFDRPPTWANTLAGWMADIDPDFLAVISDTTFKTTKNTVDSAEKTYDTVTEKFFLPSRAGLYGGVLYPDVVEDPVFPYYKDFSDLSAAGIGADSNRIKLLNGTAVAWAARTVMLTSVNTYRVVTATGAFDIKSASSDIAVAPVCNIA